MNFIANSKKQPLAQHLFAVGVIAKEILEQSNITDIEIINSGYQAGCTHDIGKVDKGFQQYLSVDDSDIENGVHIPTTNKKFSFNTHPRHNEISFAILAESDDVTHSVKHAVYWHHARPRRTDKVQGRFNQSDDILYNYCTSVSQNKTMKDDDGAVLFNDAQKVMLDVEELARGYNIDIYLPTIKKRSNIIEFSQEITPAYKSYRNTSTHSNVYKSIAQNARHDVIRMAVITADRIVSKLSKELLESCISRRILGALIPVQKISNLPIAIQDSVDYFEKKYPNSAQNVEQERVATQLADVKKIAGYNQDVDDFSSVAVLRGPAGCGKTKIGLQWALKTGANKVYWVCPRVQVCQSVYSELIKDEYLKNCKVEILTGEYKEQIVRGKARSHEPYSGTVVITTIDQIINGITTHNQAVNLFDVMQSHVIFDEFHELVSDSAHALIFSELVKLLGFKGVESNTLLLSATPNPSFLDYPLNIRESQRVSVKSFNTAEYNIIFKEYTDDDSPIITDSFNDNTIAITNTALDAQLGYMKHLEFENSICYHSRYTKEDKTELFDKVYDSFKRNGTKNIEVLRSGPIVQASLNITCFNMLTEMCTAENWLQRLGRLDRFNESTKPSDYITVLQKAKSKKIKWCVPTFLSNILMKGEYSRTWFLYLYNKLGLTSKRNCAIMTINKLYELYDNFHKCEEYKNVILDDIDKTLKRSAGLIDDVVKEPFPIGKAITKTSDTIIIRENSLRGNSRFIQLAKLKYIDGNFIELNEYACEDTGDKRITEQFTRINGDGYNNLHSSADSLIGYMQRKHHRFIKGAKKLSNNEIDWKSKQQDSPVFLSYTKNDRQDYKRHCNAMYYIVTDKQAVGSIPYSKIVNESE